MISCSNEKSFWSNAPKGTAQYGSSKKPTIYRCNHSYFVKQVTLMRLQIWHMIYIVQFYNEIDSRGSSCQEFSFVNQEMSKDKTSWKNNCEFLKDLFMFHLSVSLLEATQKFWYVFQVEWSRLNARNVDEFLTFFSWALDSIRDHLRYTIYVCSF